MSQGILLQYCKVLSNYTTRPYAKFLYHNKCYNKLFIFRSPDDKFGRTICGRWVKMGEHVVEEEKYSENSDFCRTSHLTIYHKECFEKYWMLPSIKYNKQMVHASSQDGAG